MAESKATAPDVSLATDADVAAALAMCDRLAGADAPALSDLVIRAAALALRDFPRANGAYRDASFELYSRVNIGLAIEVADALVVPTLPDADRMSIAEIAGARRLLTERAREGVITPPELSGGTFTIFDLGVDSGISRYSAVLNPPQAAILAVAGAEPRAVVRDGALVASDVLTLTLTCDHRILYGRQAAAFLARIRERLERPESLDS